jgi:phosphatidylglycerophosphate synthase
MGRLEKFILIIAGSLAEHFLPVGKWPRGSWLEFALIIVGLTSFITAVQRLVYAKKVLGNKKEV